MPDVALAAAMATFFYSLFLFPGYRKFFLDSDAGWHIRAGERMLAERALPKSEPFSFTMRGSPWYAWEWAADVMIGTIHENWGLTGVAFFSGFAIAAGVWLWFRLNWLAGGDFLLACLFAAPMISSTTLHWLARPHVVSWLFLLGALSFAEFLRRRPRLTAGHIVSVAFLSCLWANVHGSFFFAPLIALIYAVGIYLGSLVWETPLPGRWQPFAVVALISAAAGFVNPYGWHLHQHVFTYLADNQLLSRIGEFQSFNFHTAGSFQIIVVLCLAALGGVLAIAQRDLPALFLSLLLVPAAIHAARGLPIVALLLLPLANGNITKSLASWQGLRLPVRRALTGFLEYSGRLRAIDAKSGGLAWAPVFALLGLALLRTHAIAAQTGFPPNEFPVAADSAVAQLPPSARLLSTDKFGGYLIYRFNGQRKVFFDGRSDLYGAQFLIRVGRLMQARPGWQKILESFQVDDALLPNDYPLIPALQSAGWKPVYRDPVCTLLTRN